MIGVNVVDTKSQFSVNLEIKSLKALMDTVLPFEKLPKIQHDSYWQ